MTNLRINSSKFDDFYEMFVKLKYPFRCYRKSVRMTLESAVLDRPLPFWFPVASPLPSHVFTGGFCLRIVGIHFGQELLQVFVFCNIPVLVARYRTSCEKMFPRLSFSVYRTARGRSDLIPCITLKNHLTRFNILFINVGAVVSAWHLFDS